MTGPEVLDVARDSITTLVLVASPLMLVGLAVGVAISLFQALTQIQEMTLVFVPKILAIFVAMLLARSWPTRCKATWRGSPPASWAGEHAGERRTPSLPPPQAGEVRKRCRSTSHSCRCWPPPSC
jgi:flagellar biosynthetic protein FliQ